MAAVARAGEQPGTVGPVLALVLVALSLGLSNFAAAIGIGVAGTDARTRIPPSAGGLVSQGGRR